MQSVRIRKKKVEEEVVPQRTYYSAYAYATGASTKIDNRRYVHKGGSREGWYERRGLWRGGVGSLRLQHRVNNALRRDGGRRDAPFYVNVDAVYASNN